MAAYTIFNISRQPVDGTVSRKGGGSPTPPERQGVFITPQSLSTFAGASAVVMLVWKACGMINHAWSESHLVAFGCSFFVGVVLYLISETDPARGPLSVRDYLIDGFVAFINVFVLTAAAVGTTQVAGSL